MQREFPLVIYKDGKKFVPVFPVKLSGGDQFLLVREMRGSQVPEGQRWTISGYTASGPVMEISGR